MSNKLNIELQIGDRTFRLAYDAPDAGGQISPTDMNARWMDERMRFALRPLVGRLEARSAHCEIAPAAEKPASKRAASGAL